MGSRYIKNFIFREPIQVKPNSKYGWNMKKLPINHFGGKYRDGSKHFNVYAQVTKQAYFSKSSNLRKGGTYYYRFPLQHSDNRELLVSA